MKLLRSGFAVWVLAASVGALAQSPAAKEEKKGPPPAVPVRAVPLVMMDAPVQVSGIGIVEPTATVRINAQVTGIIEKVHFVEGDDVKKGDVLFTIDSRSYMAAYNEVNANLDRDKAQAESAQRQVDRYKPLVGRGAVTESEYDRYQTEAATALQTVKADEAALASAKLQIDYCTIKSPVDGRTGSLDEDAGNLVRANDTSPMVTIHQLHPIKVAFSVPEKYLPQVQEFQAKSKLPVEVAPPDTDEAPEKGRLTFIDNEVDRTAGTILLKATFDNESEKLWPGAFVNATLTMTVRPQAILAPDVAVQAGQQGDFIYVVKADNTVEYRLVKVLDRWKDMVVLDGAGKPGEMVVTDGHLKLRNGVKVEIAPQAEKVAAAAKTTEDAATAK
ncbi:efflux RND transporter periplasmic adaptor subunit [soil metagenome]